MAGKKVKEPESGRGKIAESKRPSHWGKHAEFKFRDDNKNSRAVR